LQTIAKSFVVFQVDDCLYIHYIAKKPFMNNFLRNVAFVLLICPTLVFSQQLTFTPINFSAEQQVTIIADVSGTPLAGETKVYMHAGVVTTSTATPMGSDWKFVKGNYGQDDGIGQMMPVSGQPNKWTITLNATLRSYFNVPVGTNIFYLAMVFRNANGSKKGQDADIFKSLSVPAYTSVTSPITNDVFVVSGNSISLSGSASESAASLEILVDAGTGYVSLNTLTNASTISASYTPASSQTINVKVKATINNNNVESISSFNIILRGNTIVQALPANVRDGINYSSDPTKATLVLIAPNKSFAYLVGDFTNWAIDNNYLMKQTPDGKRFWFELNGLTSGVEYVFQYWVDGTIKVGDPLADKVSDPYNDSFIPASLYPNLPINTRTNNGIATVLQTNQTPYNWASTEQSWVAPDKKELVVYELLVRDFLSSHSYNDLTDTLNYLKRLGVNAIELMPIMEFEGNLSWGYNPSYFLAPDKYYGTKAALKKFIEKAHQKGIAVILDMVLNHAFGQNPMVQMYFDKSANKPKDNPWFNPDAKHPFNVGYDFNHESQYTKDFVDTVCGYWLKEYHFDGFRFDLSKGFTQTNNPTDVGAWGNYDQSRINILTRMANKIWTLKPNAYVILEHFAASSEETVLAANGMLLWGNMTGAYADALEGNSSAGIEQAARNSHINYMESHDEERLMVGLTKSGLSSSFYNVKDLPVALNRAKMGAAFFYTVPGPKMLWQFGELGYDKSINLCGNGTENGGCRTDNKPLPWGSGSLNYYTNDDRQRVFKTFAGINKLIASNKDAFKKGSFTFTSVGDFRQINIKHSTLEIAIIGNFITNYREVSGVFSKTGTWFDYFGNTSIIVTDVNQPIILAPGEFHIYTSVQQQSPGVGLVDFLVTGLEPNSENRGLTIFPNPTNKGLVTVHLDNWPAGKVIFRFIDLTGRELNKFNYENLSQDVTLEHKLTPGIYLLDVSQESGSLKKFAKIIVE
jgi:glycosidase